MTGICESFSGFEWKIPDFFTRMEVGSSFESPFMKFQKTNFFLKIDPKFLGRSYSQRRMSISIQNTGWNCAASTLHATLDIKTRKLTKNIFGKTISKFSKECLSIEMSDLLKFKSKLAPSVTLTITCTFRRKGVPSTKAPREAQTDVPRSCDKGEEYTHLDKKAPREAQTDVPRSCDKGEEYTHLDKKDKTLVSREAQTDFPTSCAEGDGCTRLDDNGGSVLRKHFKDLLLGADDHDVILKFKGKEFKAHKNILRARSPVFAAMFTHNIKEVECRDVTMKDCDPDAFSKFLEYVYTGKVDNLTASNASQLYIAGAKYNFRDLKKTCVEFLTKTSLSTNVVCEVIHMADKHKEVEILDVAMAFFTHHLVEIWQTVEWQRFLERNPVLANKLNIQAMESYKKVV